MIRKQIYLQENMINQIKKLAKKNNLSESEIIRRALSDYIRKQQLKGEVKDPLLELIGLGESDSEVDSGVDNKYLYEGDNDE
jgi:metal-responsive CopG/Arc/MetJ family transcriptional regulator